MLIETDYRCAYCGALNDTTVDPSGGPRQNYIEDCQVCCKPNELYVEIDRKAGTAQVTAQATKE
jgi:hypothetical protein